MVFLTAYWVKNSGYNSTISMKTIKCFISNYSIVLIILLVLPGKVIGGTLQSAYVEKVVDGDSVVLVREMRKIKARLWGIDCPEWDQPFSLQAKLSLKADIEGRKIQYERLYTDEFGRSIIRLYSNGVYINERIIERGHGWVHPYFCKSDICHKWVKMEETARVQKKGLWHKDDPVPPWIWKRVRRHDE